MLPIFKDCPTHVYTWSGVNVHTFKSNTRFDWLGCKNFTNFRLFKWFKDVLDQPLLQALQFESLMVTITQWRCMWLIYISRSEQSRTFYASLCCAQDIKFCCKLPFPCVCIIVDIETNPIPNHNRLSVLFWVGWRKADFLIADIQFC